MISGFCGISGFGFVFLLIIEMASLGMVSNNILGIFGNLQIPTKFGTLDPVSYVDIFQKIQETNPNHLKQILFLEF